MTNGKVDFGMAKNLAQQNQDLHWQDVFPDGEFCPFQPAATFQKKDADKVIMVRVYHPCLSKCALYDIDLGGCSLKAGPGALAE